MVLSIELYMIKYRVQWSYHTVPARGQFKRWRARENTGTFHVQKKKIIPRQCE